MAELQALLDEWIVAVWQNRPARRPAGSGHPGQGADPERAVRGVVERPAMSRCALGPADYVELLPVTWRAINTYGISIDQRTYRRRRAQPLPASALRSHDEGRGLWEVHHDPYDISQIWVRNHHGEGWSGRPAGRTCAPCRARSGSWPGTTPATSLAAAVATRAPEAEIAEAAAGLLRPCAEHGPDPTRSPGPNRTSPPVSLPDWPVEGHAGDQDATRGWAHPGHGDADVAATRRGPRPARRTPREEPDSDDLDGDVTSMGPTSRGRPRWRRPRWRAGRRAGRGGAAAVVRRP